MLTTGVLELVQQFHHATEIANAISACAFASPSQFFS